ncbi:MAG: hypothetical protein V4553_22090 [Bacteroidota bacterium]
MKKFINISGFVIGAIFLFCIGRCFYMVACISCTPSDIETYKYSGSMDELENGLKAFANSNSKMKCKVSYRGGTTDFSARDVAFSTIVRADMNTYNMVIYDFNNSTRLALSCIYRKHGSKNIGGCDPKDKDVEALFDNFKIQFLPQIEKVQGVILKTTLF